MLESIDNNLNSNEGETWDLGNQASENPQQNPSRGPAVALEVSSSIEDLNY